MSDYETYTCSECGTEFRAHPSSNAAAREQCSPRCATNALR
ncbi:hypothetical protein ACFQH6_09620 [Halobacteriaceae archaeon GCM10025711]